MLDRYDEEDFEAANQDWKRRRRTAALPHVSRVVERLLARKGFTQVGHHEGLESAWKTAVPQGVGRTRCGRLVRGVLEVMVADSTLLMELTFDKRGILQRLRKQPEAAGVRDLRFRVGDVS